MMHDFHVGFDRKETGPTGRDDIFEYPDDVAIPFSGKRKTGLGKYAVCRPDIDRILDMDMFYEGFDPAVKIP